METRARRQRVAVVGVGSVGGYFAAQLDRAGHDVALCVRQPFEVLRVHSGGVWGEVHAKVFTEPDGMAPVDWVLLATKAQHTESVGDWLATLCQEGCRVAVLQNGVEHEERVRPLVRGLDGVDVLPVIVKYGGERLEPGVIEHYTYGYLTVPDGPVGRDFAGLFEGASAEVRLTSDFTTAAWTKLCTNVAANAVPALTMQRFPVFRRPDIARLSVALIRECATVGAAEGAHLPGSIAEDEVERLSGLPDDVGSSMLYDRLAGRTLEHDALNGAVVRFGVEHGIETPLNEATVALLAAISDAAPR